MNDNTLETNVLEENNNGLATLGHNGYGETSPEETEVSEDGVFHVTEDDTSHTVTVH